MVLIVMSEKVNFFCSYPFRAVMLYGFSESLRSLIFDFWQTYYTLKKHNTIFDDQWLYVNKNVDYGLSLVCDNIGKYN